MISPRALLIFIGVVVWGLGGVSPLSWAPLGFAQDAMPDDALTKPPPKPGASDGAAPPVPAQAPSSQEGASPEDEGDVSDDRVTLGGLDKVSARVVTLEAEVGQTTHFGTLEIIVRACRQHRPEERPENAAFLDIWDLKPGKPAQSIFRGWMFSSSPALSAMEHPIYDIWVLSCHSSHK